MKVFISHSSTDKKFVRKLKDDLNENDIDTWFDEDELHLGDTLLEKLNGALESTSHVIVVLSQASINSDWVHYELEKALSLKKSNLLKKIIPVKYKECQVPVSIENLLYWDLSKETREIQGDRVNFSSNGYLQFLSKLCNSIKSEERKITIQEKAELKEEIIHNTNIEPNTAFVRASYLVIGYRSSLSRDDYTKVVSSSKINISNEIQIKPVLLPPLLKHVFKNLQIGDSLLFSKNFLGSEIGHFAGYRKDDLAITLDYRIRKGIFVKTSHRYSVEIDIANKKIIFISK